MSDRSLLEDEGGAGGDVASSSNLTKEIEGPIKPFHKILRRKTKKELSTIVEDIIADSIQEAFGKQRSIAGYYSKQASDNRVAGDKVLQHTAGGRSIKDSYNNKSKPVDGRSLNRYYYAVPFSEKDQAKSAGLRWDPEEKKWYATRPGATSKWKVVKTKVHESNAHNEFKGDSYFEALEIPNLEAGLKKRRHTLPQLKEFDLFKKDLEENKVKMHEPKDFAAKDLTPTQSNFNEEKVDGMIENGKWNDKPIIVSKDDYVIDGHHRWLAAVKLDKPIKAREVDLTAEELLDFLKDKDYVIKHTIKQ